MHRRFGHNKGEDHPSAVLTEDKVREAWTLKARGLIHRDIAKCLGVSESAVQKILSRRTWTHVAPPY